MRATERLVLGVLTAVAIGGALLAAQNLDRRQAGRVEETLRHEGEAVIRLADDAAEGRKVPSDFSVEWHNDFFKAQPGTFVPFIVRITSLQSRTGAALLYVRAAHRAAEADGRRNPRRTDIAAVFHPFEDIYPIDLSAEKGKPVRIARGFSLPPGEYDLTVVVRERERGGERSGRRLAAVLSRPLSVPDFSGGELTTSTVILADRLTMLLAPVPPDQVHERPYAIGNREIQPAADPEFSRREELIVVFLVYNPSLREDKQFDLEVEYHFFRNAGSGESYFNRTEPQRFNPAVLGPAFDPSTGQPVLAGQGIPLSGFQEGDYRLAIRVKDLVSGRSVERQVRFTVRS